MVERPQDGPLPPVHPDPYGRPPLPDGLGVPQPPTVPRHQIAGWWYRLAEHGAHRRCRTWADAFASLIAHDLYHRGPSS